MATPRPPSSSNRGPNGKQGGSAVSKKAERPPGTPRRETKEKEKEKALYDPDVLKEYRLGECLGRGAFGSVYKAFNWGTGETVAVKQIKLGNLPKSEQKMIAAEIDLLKNLKHDNIVKYLGFAKSEACLNIILEYCENGSLHSICKNYGKFPENLVGLYMGQVLQGLLYLHEQGVIHRDIKGANILTTKDGKVKLADFGVSTSTLAGADKEAQVVGTPYWMAPEVIQLSGATTASDIWSLGATVIELLEGNPPYYHMQPMPALFAIVNDDHPPLPQGASRATRDFLLQCFQKDPNLRVSARRLLKHVWITCSRRTEDAVHEVPKNYKEAVEEVKKWNDALRSPEAGSIRASTKPSTSHQVKRDAPLRNIHNEKKAVGKSAPLKNTAVLGKPRNSAEAFRSPENPGDDNWDNDFLSDISPNGLRLPQLKPQDNFGGLLSSEKLKALASDNLLPADNLKAFASSVDLSSINNSPCENWDGDFEYHTIRAPVNATEMATIRPSSSTPTANGGNPGPRSDVPRMLHQTPQNSRVPRQYQYPDQFMSPAPPELRLRYSNQFTEQFGTTYDANDDGSVFDGPQEQLRRESVLSPKLFDMSDFSGPRGRPAPLHGFGENSPEQAMSSAKIQKYAETEGEGDYSDIVSETGSEDGALRLIPKNSLSSWPQNEDDDDDPFASLVPEVEEYDAADIIARDEHAKMCANIKRLVESIRITQSADVLLEASEDLLDILFESPEYKKHIMKAHAMIPILEVLDEFAVKNHPEMIVSLLRLINALISNDVIAQNHLCNAGGIPIMTKYAETKFSNDIRLESAAFVRQMYQTDPSILQLFVCAGGLNVLIEFLMEDYDESKDLVLIGVNGIWNVFELQTVTPKNDFCRIFSRHKILSPLSEILNRVLDDKPVGGTAKNTLTEQIEGRIVSIFMLFSKSENYVKEVVADRMVLKSVLKDLHRMSSDNQVIMLRFIKHLSMLPATLDAIHSSNAMELLIRLVEQGMERGQSQFREICNEFLQIMFYLCRLNKARQADAAREGIIFLVLRLVNMPELNLPKAFVVPLLCDMAHSGKSVTNYLWKNNGLQYYVDLLSEYSWQFLAMDAIYTWHQEETARAEKNLLEGNFSKAIINCINSDQFDYNLLEPLQKLLRLSPAVAETLARPEMFSGLTQKLSHKKPDIRLNLLRLVCSVCDPKQGHTNTLRRCGLLDVIQSLAENEPTVLIKNMAGDFVKACLDKEERENSGGRRRVASGFRRTSSYNMPQEQGYVSSPVTPTSKSRSRQAMAYLEEPVTPQRRPITPQRRPMTPMDTPGESIISRERSRESRESSFMFSRPSVDAESIIRARRPSADTSDASRRPSGDAGAPSGKSRLPRTAALKSSRSSAASLSPGGPKEYQQPTTPGRRERESITRVRGDTKSIDSGRPSAPPVSMNARRRTKTQTSQDLRTS